MLSITKTQNTGGTQNPNNALFDGMYSRAKDPVKHQVEQIQVNGVQGHLNDRTPPHEKLRTR